MLGFKKGVLVAFGVLLLALSFSVQAGTFTTEIVPVSDTIMGVEQAKFQIRISNLQSYDDTFRVRVPEVFWSVQSVPLSDYFSGVQVPGKSTADVSLLINPIQALPNGQYKIEIEIESLNTGIAENKYVTVSSRSGIASPKKEYVVAVSKKVAVPQKVDPRMPVPLRIDLVNRNPRNIPEMVVSVRSALVNADIPVSVGPLGKVTIYHNVSLDPRTAPQRDTLEFAFAVDGIQVDEPLRASYEVVGYTDVSEEQRAPVSGFLMTSYETNYVNRGNSPVVKRVDINTDFITSLFTSASPQAYVVSGSDGKHLVWDLSISPGQSVVVRRTVSFRPVFIFLAISALLIMLYYLFRSPISVRKEAAVIGFEEDGISDIKVILHIRNRSGREFMKVSIADRVPSIASIEKEKHAGIIEPSKVLQGRDGSLIKWDLDKLERREERVFSYTIKSKLSIIGRFSLPSCSVAYSDNGKERKTNSGSSHVRV